MKRICLLCLVLLPPVLGAQQRRGGEPYLMPQIVFVGDRGTLVVPLEQNSGAALKPGGSGREGMEKPVSGDLVIHAIHIEGQGGEARLLIDFTAYAPGVLDLPAIELAVPGKRGMLRFEGLKVEIASILISRGDAPVLSGPAAPLTVPGTAFFIYGVSAAFLLLLLFLAVSGIWGRRRFGSWMERWRRRRLVSSLAGMERRLRRDLLRGGGKKDYAETLGFLSGEFRSFLEYFTGLPCRTMTAGELGGIPPLAPSGEPELAGRFLEALFRRCDFLRFSGAVIRKEDLLSLLNGIKSFGAALDGALKARGQKAGSGAAGDLGESA